MRGVKGGSCSSRKGGAAAHPLLLINAGGAGLASLTLIQRQFTYAGRHAAAVILSPGCLPSSLTSLELQLVWFDTDKAKAWQRVQLPRLQELRLRQLGGQLGSAAATAFGRWAERACAGVGVLCMAGCAPLQAPVCGMTTEARMLHGTPPLQAPGQPEAPGADGAVCTGRGAAGAACHGAHPPGPAARKRLQRASR